jgi:1,4-dihydroxy-6-naphthoate synthase
MIELAISNCPNDTFIFDAWIHGKITSSLQPKVHFADIQQLNIWAQSERFPIIKMSSFCFSKVSAFYRLLPVGAAIGNFGPKLIAKTAFDLSELPSKRVAVPGFDTTACLLFRSLLPQAKELIACPYDQIASRVADGQVDAGVIIHETRFTYSQAGLVELCDLGTLFSKTYDLPVPLGVIAVHKSLPDATVNQAIESIRSSIAYARKNPESSLDFVLQHSIEKKQSIVQQHIQTYVTDETVDISQRGYMAIQRLLSLKAQVNS